MRGHLTVGFARLRPPRLSDIEHSVVLVVLRAGNVNAANADRLLAAVAMSTAMTNAIAVLPLVPSIVASRCALNAGRNLMFRPLSAARMDFPREHATRESCLRTSGA